MDETEAGIGVASLHVSCFYRFVVGGQRGPGVQSTPSRGH